MCGGGGGWRGSGSSGGSGNSGDNRERPPISPQNDDEEESQEDAESDSQEDDDSSPGTSGAGIPTSGEGNEPDREEGSDSDESEDTEQDDGESAEREDDQDTESEDESEENEDEDCFIDEDTNLESTNPVPLDDALLGDVFLVEIQKGRPCVVDEDDRILGSILGDLGEVLLQCIAAGYRYRAEILEIEDRKCKVRVTNRCLINSTAMLASPDPDQLRDISEGQILDVGVREGSLCVISEADRAVGPIAKPWSRTLIHCIESAGLDYIAEVIDIDGGACEVRVKNKSLGE